MNLRKRRSKPLIYLDEESDYDSRFSDIETQADFSKIPLCPIFKPSVEEFKKPMEYLRKIQPEAQKFGICKIVPPQDWKASTPDIFFGCDKTFPTKKQFIHRLEEGFGHDDGKDYTAKTFKRKAEKVFENFIFKVDPNEMPTPKKSQVPPAKSKRSRRKLPRINASELLKKLELNERLEFIEKKYWEIVETGNKFEVEYGSDISVTDYVSGFGTSDSNWNLTRLPKLAGSLLRYLGENISGVNVPWVYFGMLFSTFCWHYEDDSLFSISYNHCGAPKIWYGTPSSSSGKLESVFREKLPELFEDEPDLLLKLATMMNPCLLKDNGVDVYKSVHMPGEFMVTFPHAYHSGFNTGFNIAEAVNFALETWLPFGLDCAELYAHFSRESVLLHDRILISTAMEPQKINPKDVKQVISALEKLISMEKRRREILESSSTKIREISLFTGTTDEKGRKCYRLSEETKICVNKSIASKESEIEERGEGHWEEQHRAERIKNALEDKDCSQCEVCKRNLYLLELSCERHSEKSGCFEHSNRFCKCLDSEAKDVKIQLSLIDLEWILQQLCDYKFPLF